MEETQTSECISSNSPKINCLSPEKLMIVKVIIKGQELDALIDSGASKSLIKGKFASDFKELSTERPVNVVGLGGTKI